MDLERLIPIVVIYVIWSIFTAKRKKKKSEHGSGEQQSSPMVQLLRLIQGQVDPEELARRAKAIDFPQEDEEEFLWETAPSSTEPPEFILKEPEKSFAEKVPDIPADLPIKQEKDKQYSRKSRYNKRTQKKLRQAIIWKEVLDKPLALRRN